MLRAHRQALRKGALATDARPCDFPECECAGEYRAPKSRRPEDGHYWFCLAHIRDYNASWDFFSGMSQAEIEAYQRGNATWHRPTWRLGPRPAHPSQDTIEWFDATDMLGHAFDFGFRAKHGAAPAQSVDPAERQALADLDLPPTATWPEIKARHKQLVKRYHPDVNGGNKQAEDRLKRINRAYTYLLSRGYN